MTLSENEAENSGDAKPVRWDFPSVRHFLPRPASASSLCTRRTRPQNWISEITSVPERVPSLIEPGGSGRPIERSAEEAAGGEYWWRRNVRDVICRRGGIGCRRAAVREGLRAWICLWNTCWLMSGSLLFSCGSTSRLLATVKPELRLDGWLIVFILLMKTKQVITMR